MRAAPATHEHNPLVDAPRRALRRPVLHHGVPALYGCLPRRRKLTESLQVFLMLVIQLVLERALVPLAELDHRPLSEYVQGLAHRIAGT